MVNPPSNNDFYAKALASFNQQVSLANAAVASEIEAYAKSLVEDDLPKIDAAVKSYLSLVAARSAVASDIDVISATSPAAYTVHCTFASSAKSPMDANRCALMCARTLLSTINSTTIPSGPTVVGESAANSADHNDEAKSGEEKKGKLQLQKDAAKVLWNRLVHSSSAGAGKAKHMKPSKVLGRDSLMVAYPYIQERFRRGTLLNDNVDDSPSAADEKQSQNQNNPLHSLSNDLLPPVAPPTGIDIDQFRTFYTEFGHLLSRACRSNDEEGNEQSPKVEDDSALIWSSDKGSAELRQRRELRAQRATEALASVEGAKAAVADALGAPVKDDG